MQRIICTTRFRSFLDSKIGVDDISTPIKQSLHVDVKRWNMLFLKAKKYLTSYMKYMGIFFFIPYLFCSYFEPLSNFCMNFKLLYGDQFLSQRNVYHMKNHLFLMKNTMMKKVSHLLKY